MKFFVTPEEAQRKRLYNRDFPWLWSICSDWSKIQQIRVLKKFDHPEIFSRFLPWRGEHKKICYFHTADAVTKVDVSDYNQPKILDAFRRFGVLGSWCQILHIAIVMDGVRIEIYRPAKDMTFEDLYRQNGGDPFS